jgi:dTDP-4-dehydrorhamnose 3,5-epimerase
MKIEDTALDGVKVILPDVYCDDRGYFFEIFQAKKYREIGIKEDFVQDNQSFSKYATIRGLHYQVGAYAQGKLIHVIKGKILDVVADIRFGSPTFGKYISMELSEENQKFIWIPTGFAHGFSVLSEDALVFYKCTAVYSPDHERGIIYSDPTLAIDWKVTNPLISKKDIIHPAFNQIKKDFIYNR